MTRALLAVALLSFLSLAEMMGRTQAAEDSPALVIDGLVKQAQHLTVAELRRMQAVQREVTFQTDRGAQKATYTGVLLWDVMQRAGIDDPAKKWPDLRHVMAVTGQDGYLVMFSVGEIDPNFGNAPIMIAYERNGQAFTGGGFRLVVPGDTHGARDIRDLVHIEIR